MVDISQFVVNNTEYNVSDDTKVPYDLLQDTVGFTSKNLLTYPYGSSTATKNGITFTDNGDGTFTLNGTASAVTSHILTGRDNATEFSRNILSFANKSVILSDGVGVSNVWIQCWVDGSGVIGSTDEPQNNSTFIIPTIDVANSQNWNFAIMVANGAVLNNLKVYPMLRKADIMDSTYEPYNPSVKQVLRNNKIIEGKNLIPFPYKDGYSVTKGGVTFTVNSNRSVTVTGSYTGTGTGAAFDLTDFTYQFVPEGTYILTDGIGARPTDADSSWYIYATKRKGASGADNYQSIDKTTGKAIITVNYSQYDYLRISLFVQKSANLGSGVTFYPMFCKATETDPTYEPYYIPGVVSQEAQNILGAKNLMYYNRSDTSASFNGIDFTLNSNGSLTLNGTATATIDKIIHDPDPFLQKGMYIVSKGIVNDDVKLNIAAKQNRAWIRNLASVQGNNSEQKFIVDYNGYNNVDVHVHVDSGVTVNNVTIYPMIRLAEIQDDTYVPYAMTNRELTGIQVFDQNSSGFAASNVTIDWTKSVMKKCGNVCFFSFLITANNDIGQYVQVVHLPTAMRSLNAVRYKPTSDYPCAMDETGNIYATQAISAGTGSKHLSGTFIV